MPDNGPFEEVVKTLLKLAGAASATMKKILPLAGGRNNRVYRLETGEGVFLLKRYFQGGDWDRLGAESRFLRFCGANGIHRVPRLLAEDTQSGMALHSWEQGESPDLEGLRQEDVDEAAAFLGDLAGAYRACSEGVLPARDSCACLEDYFRSPGQRLVELGGSLDKDGEEEEARARARIFFHETLLPAWERARRLVSSETGKKRLPTVTPVNKLVVSPSDFGFHNALCRQSGGITFVDFEYAGIDDPVKAIGDFVSQPDFPPPPGALETLARKVYDSPGDGAELAERTRILLPLFHIKFCCIILNDFKSGDAARRAFSLAGNHGERLMRQLDKAHDYLKRHSPQWGDMP